MRIIAGSRRGHSIQGPNSSKGMRPTSDLVRESIFNIIGPEVEDRAVVDLFAGTGALGLEAVSRGALSALFVEKRGQNAALIRKNAASLRFEGVTEVVVGNAYSWAASFEPGADAGPMVVFLDPPYREYEENGKKLQAMLGMLVARLPVGSTIVAESGRALGADILPDPEAWDLRRYGDTHVAIRTLELPVEEA